MENGNTVVDDADVAPTEGTWLAIDEEVFILTGGFPGPGETVGPEFDKICLDPPGPDGVMCGGEVDCELVGCDDGITG